jgi:hypothetical protein
MKRFPQGKRCLRTNVLLLLKILVVRSMMDALHKDIILGIYDRKARTTGQ